MARISITEASRKFSVGRSTLYRHIESGRITVHSENDLKYLDTSDLIRLYRPIETSNNAPIDKDVTVNERAGIYLIAARNEIKILQNHINLLKDQIEKKDELLSLLTRLLPKPKN